MNTEQAIKALKKLHKLCPANDDGDEMSEAIVDAVVALRAQQERENPKPLTLDELRERIGKPVWFDEVYIDGRPTDQAGWDVLREISTGTEDIFIFDNMSHYGADYGDIWLAYAHEPKEES